MKYLLCGLMCTVFSLGEAAAQHVMPPKEEFLDSAWHVLPSATGARYHRETDYTGGKAGTIRTYFIKGQPLSSYTYEDLEKHLSSGSSDEWYENGQLKLHREYTHGQASGELRRYYPSGQLKRQETYLDGQRTSGQCFGPDGASLAFFEYYVMAVYPLGNGNPSVLNAVIARNFQYPVEPRHHRITGQLLVEFQVSKTGEVDNIQVTKGLSPAIDAAAIRAVQQLQRFTPALEDGQPVRSGFGIPLYLN